MSKKYGIYWILLLEMVKTTNIHCSLSFQTSAFPNNMKIVQVKGYVIFHFRVDCQIGLNSLNWNHSFAYELIDTMSLEDLQDSRSYSTQ